MIFPYFHLSSTRYFSTWGTNSAVFIVSWYNILTYIIFHPSTHANVNTCHVPVHHLSHSCTPEGYTNGYSICVCPLCVLENGCIRMLHHLLWLFLSDFSYISINYSLIKTTEQKFTPGNWCDFYIMNIIGQGLF